MKTLILTDQTWMQMTGALVATDSGRAILARLDAEPAIPSDRDLIAAARNDETPHVFERRAAERDAGRQAAEDTRRVLEDLIRHAHAAGVGPTVLSRWSGLRPRRIYEILET